MATNTDFLRFSAYSIKDLITRKLAQDSNFTDQVYEGSNLAVLIDIFSYMAQCLLYSLNNAAAESMFADTQIYENMNRLVKFLDYHPKGCNTSIAEFALNNTGSAFEGKKIPKYSYINTNKVDELGKPIYYSLMDSQMVNTNDSYSVIMYNGRWKMYSTVFTSSGSEYQSFTLDGIESNSDNNKYVPDIGIHVYVDENPNGSNDNIIQYKMVDQGIFTDNNIENGTFIHTSNDAIFDLRLNENKTYEITFGNGYSGKIPPEGSLIYVLYLDSNGPYGKIDLGEISDAEMIVDSNHLGIEENLYNAIVNQTDSSQILKKEDDGKTPIWKNISNSSSFIEEESVNDIRIHAPNWFKTGNRLVTHSDYEYYFKNKNRNLVIDVVCQNNWEYISTFYRWLYNLNDNGNFVKSGKRKTTKQNYYINQNRLMKYDYKWADAADVNNIYLWIKMRNESDILKSQFDKDIQNIKTLTQEAVYLNPLEVYFSPCAETIDTALNYFNPENGSQKFDPNNNSYIEITLDDNSIYTNIDIQSQVANIIQNFFDEDKQTLGMIIDFSKLTNEIYNIGTISRIRTVYHNKKTEETIIKPGLSFASWTSSVIDLGDDLNISNTSMSLEVFQFPKLYNSETIENKIKVIRRSINNINTIQY